MENSHHTLPFARVAGKKVEADFDGGSLTQDGGMLLLRTAEAVVGVVKRMVAALRDRRHPSYIDHTYEDLLRQRVFQIACGYEDANDSDELRSDPALKTACERARERARIWPVNRRCRVWRIKSAAPISTAWRAPCWTPSWPPTRSRPRRSSSTSTTLRTSLMARSN